jgi:ribonuclease P protein component
MRAVARLNQATKRQRAGRPNPKHFRSQIFHAEAHISAQSPQPFEDTRLPQPYEDEERRRSAVAEARQRPQACFRQRGFSRLSLPVCFPFRPGGWISIVARLPPPKVRKNGEMPEAGFDWRSARLRKHADYQRVYQESRRHSSASMSYFFRARSSEDPTGAAPRVGLTAGRVLGGAVERNRIRRRMREAVRLHLGELPLHVDVVLHPRKTVLEMEFARLEREVARVFASVADGAEGKR